MEFFLWKLSMEQNGKNWKKNFNLKIITFIYGWWIFCHWFQKKTTKKNFTCLSRIPTNCVYVSQRHLQTRILFWENFSFITISICKMSIQKENQIFFFIYHHVIYHVIIVSNYNANIFIINSVTFIWINKIYTGKSLRFLFSMKIFHVFFSLKWAKGIDL